MLSFQLLSVLRAGWLLNILSFSPALLIDNVAPECVLNRSAVLHVHAGKESCEPGPKDPCVMRRPRNYFPKAGGQKVGAVTLLLPAPSWVAVSTQAGVIGVRSQSLE